jgi:hypothetical protein
VLINPIIRIKTRHISGVYHSTCQNMITAKTAASAETAELFWSTASDAAPTAYSGWTSKTTLSLAKYCGVFAPCRNGCATETVIQARDSGTMGLWNPLLGNCSVNTLQRRRNDVTSQQCLVITWILFSVWSALRNSGNVFSALSVPRLYNTSPLAAKKKTNRNSA